MNQELLEKYALLAKQISTLEAEQSALKPQVAEMLTKEDLQEFKADYGTFYFTKRKTWEYPDEIKEAEKKFKEMKKIAETDGTAIYEESESLAFRMAKEAI